MSDTVLSLRENLFELRDLKYRDFHSRLIPSVPKEQVIGIRTPVLRKFAKEYVKTEEAAEFIKILPHEYYEENNLHMLIISAIRDYEMCIAEIERFLPFIDNWATCDMPVPRCFYENKEDVLERAKRWIKSDEAFTVRYGIGVLMSMFLDEDFDPEYPRLVASVRSEQYYVNMMIAWYFATALAKKWDEVIPFIEKRQLDKWTHNKAIQKAVESYRITSEQKAYLKSLKIK